MIRGDKRALSPELRTARRALEGMREVTLLGDCVWSEPHSEWILHCRLTIDVGPEGLVPPSTDWYVRIAPGYPWGSIRFYPAKEEGIAQTFQHQNYNANGAGDIPWRTGDLCLSTVTRVLGRHGHDIEPHETDARLRWHFARAIEWLATAARNELTLPGDPFELPHFPLSNSNRATFVFSEGSDSFGRWEQIPDRYGLVDLTRLSENPSIIVVNSFHTIGKKVLVELPWGTAIRHNGGTRLHGVWLRLGTIPVLTPWQAPATWGELQAACQLQGEDVYALLRETARTIRDGVRHVLLIGSPMPRKIGEQPCQLHWQAMFLPVLSWGTKAKKGFRPNSEGYWRRDRTEVIRDDTPIEWLTSENWHSGEITSRGRLPDGVCSKAIAIIGAGAVGCMIAELLVRAGVSKIVIIDADILEAGNLTRHILGMESINKPKAIAVADRLNLASPNAVMQGIAARFPPEDQTHRATVEACELIVDCTGSDELLHHLAAHPWSSSKTFVSVSLGIEAKRLFCFMATGPCFPDGQFRYDIQPWLEQELQEYQGYEFPREGVGCWHPVFPARIDDIWPMAAQAVREIERAVRTPPNTPELVVFEQQHEGGVFVGIRRVP